MKQCPHRGISEQTIGRMKHGSMAVVQECLDCGQFRMMNVHNGDAIDQWTRWMGEDVREG